MAFKEQNAFTNFKDASMGVLNMKRIENMIAEGMPDVIGINRSGSAFWLELKAYDEWPKRATTCILKNKFEKGQLGFMASWRSWNGHAFVLLRVAGVYYLLPPLRELPAMTKAQLVETSIAIGREKVIEYLGKFF